MRKRKGFYSISVVAKMLSVHQQTIRMYEKQGLISPKRSSGNTRLFAEEDVDRLEEVIYLTHKLGVNLAGVEMILKLQRKIKRMQEDMNKLFTDTEGELEIEARTMRDDMKKNVERLVTIRKDSPTPKESPLQLPFVLTDQPTEKAERKKKATKAPTKAPKQVPVVSDEETTLIDDFEIEYDKD
jgi:MerR family transcriptional regulator, heat shock protein HspR